jgi:hypothetical protein
MRLQDLPDEQISRLFVTMAVQTFCEKYFAGAVGQIRGIGSRVPSH